jgi:rod shape determining protein RodA
VGAMAMSRGGVWERVQRYDLFLLGCVSLILFIGAVFVGSASSTLTGSGGTLGILGRQLLYIGMGVTVLVALQRVHYRTILENAPLLYLAGLILLSGVFLTRPINGARSWYNLYVFKLQPSELMKPILILTLSHYLMYRDSYKRLSGLAVPLVLALVPMLLILKQPDLGTFLCFAPMVFILLYAAGAKLWHLLLMMLAGNGAMVLMWFTVMKEYQKRRVFAWLDPEQYRLNEAWQLLRAETAIGSGGLFGKGWGQASQSGLNLLPEKHTDFIFAVIAEEGGFVVAALLLLLIFCVTLAGLNIALRTREPAGRLIATGCVAMFSAQSLINIGVAIGLLPTTGLTLPFVSYGGSSMLSAFICLGLLLNVSAQQDMVLTRDQFD